MENNTMEIIKSLFYFNGRMNRKSFFLVFLAIFVLVFIFTLIGQGIMAFVVWSIATLLHAFSTVKRLHDLNKPGVHYWLSLVPIYNLYFAMVLFTRKGTVGANIYGDDPVIGVNSINFFRRFARVFIKIMDGTE